MISDWVAKFTHTTTRFLLIFQTKVSPYCFNVIYDSFQDLQRCAHMNNAKDQTIIRLYL